MATNVISTSRPMKVPQPSTSATFVLGSRPATLRSPPIQRVKPSDPSTREYGKSKQLPSFGSTGMTGET